MEMLDNFPTSFNKEEGSNNKYLFDAIEIALHNVRELALIDLDYVFIESSTGIYLDKLGLLFGLDRKKDELDEDYKVRLLSLSGNETVLSGTEQAIMNNIRKEIDVDEDDILFNEIRNLVFNVDIYITPLIDLSEVKIRSIIDSTKAAGVLVKTVDFFAKFSVVTSNLSYVNGPDFLL